MTQIIIQILYMNKYHSEDFILSCLIYLQLKILKKKEIQFFYHEIE